MQRIYKVTGKHWYSTEYTSFFVAAESSKEAIAKTDKKMGYENFDIKQKIKDISISKPTVCKLLPSC